MANYILEGGRVVDPKNGTDKVMDIGIDSGVFCKPVKVNNPIRVNVKGLIIAPGFIDMHVHLRQPGAVDKETIKTGSMAAAAGNLSTLITDRNFIGSFDPEMVKKADHDFWGKLIAGTLVELNVQIGSVAGNIIKIGSPAGTSTAQYTELSDAERESIRTLGANFKMVSVTDEAEFAIVIT